MKLLSLMLVSATLAAGQAAAYRAPRADGGKPDLNGIWPAINEANYDLQAPTARPAMALRAGPASVDSGMGQSVRHWEWETLVVDVTGKNNQTWFDRSGNFHSHAWHLV